MSNPMIRIHDLSTNQVIDREMNDAEFAKYEAEQAVFKAEQSKAEENATAKAALLKKLGITEAEAKLLLA